MGRTPDNLRVLFVHDSGRFEGGASRVLHTLLTERDPCRVECFAALCGTGDLASALRRAEIAVTILPSARINSTEHFPLTLSSRGIQGVARYTARLRLARASLARAISVLRPDVVHVFTSSLPWACGVASAHGVPAVLHIHDFSTGRVGAYLARRSARGAGCVLCVSGAVEEQFRRLVPGTKTVQIPSPIDPARGRPIRSRESVRRELGIGTHDKVAIYVGQIISAKGSRLLVPIMERLGRQVENPTLLVVGRTEPPRLPAHAHYARKGLSLLFGPSFLREDDRLRHDAHAHARGARIIFCGHREDVADLLAASDAAILPNTAPEPYGLVADEAVAVGVPLVAADLPAYSERFSESAGVILVPPGDPDGFSTVLAKLFRSPHAPIRRRFPQGDPFQRLRDVWERLLGCYEDVAAAGNSPCADPTET